MILLIRLLEKSRIDFVTKFKNCIRLCFVPLHQPQVSILTALHTDPLRIPELIIQMLTRLQIPIVTRQCICQPQKVFQHQDMIHRFPIHFIHPKIRKLKVLFVRIFSVPNVSVAQPSSGLSNLVSRLVSTCFAHDY